MKKFLLLYVLLFSSPAFAAEPCNTLDLKVSGLVCDFCARSIEKTFGKRDEVQSVAVDLDKGNIHLVLKEGKTLEEATARQLITDAGYNMTAIEKGC